MTRLAPLFATAAVTLFGCGGSSGDATGGAGGASTGTATTAGPTSGPSSSGSMAGSTTTSGGGGTSGGGAGPGIAAKYPGDVGIDKDPAVIWAENFEEGTVLAVTARYDDKKNEAAMTLMPDVPPKSGGKASIKWDAGGGVGDATDVFKKLPDHDEVWVRWYAKYQAGITWHHTGVWIGGYNPAESYPNPQAGLKPNGDDRFSVSIEPAFDVGGPAPRLDFYDYWMTMHSWMAQPMGNTAYYGNSMIHQNGFTVDQDQWMCIEVHIKLNTDPASSAGAARDVWKNDALVQHYDQSGVLGYWIRDKFCPMGADGTECTDYPAPAGTQMIPLDLQERSTLAYGVNAFWPQNYITEGPQGSVQFDDMVVASARIGCIQ